MRNNGQISTLQWHLAADIRQVMEHKVLPNKHLAELCGVSESTMSELLRSKRAFSKGLLGRVSRKLVDFQNNSNHFFTSLRQYQKLIRIAEVVRKKALFSLVCGRTGTGKTATLRQIYVSKPATFYLKVEDDMSWREVLRKIAEALCIKDPTYHPEALRERLKQRIEYLVASRPLLIIDEAEELFDSVFRKLKRLHTLTEGQMGVLIVAHPALRRRLAMASGLQPETGQPLPGRTETQYATFWRRLTHFEIPAVSEEDIESLCRDELGIQDEAVIALAQQRWTNYGQMGKALRLAEAANMIWDNMTVEEFEFLASN